MWFYSLVKRALSKVAAKPSKRKQPINTDILMRMYKRYKIGIKRDLYELQTITMAYLAHAGLLRGSELLNLRKRNFKISSDWKKLEITIEVSKMTHTRADKTEKIYLVHFPVDERNDSTNATELLRQYWDRWGIDDWSSEAFMFPQLSKDGTKVNYKTQRSKKDFVNNNTKG